MQLKTKLQYGLHLRQNFMCVRNQLTNWAEFNFIPASKTFKNKLDTTVHSQIRIVNIAGFTATLEQIQIHLSSSNLAGWRHVQDLQQLYYGCESCNYHQFSRMKTNLLTPGRRRAQVWVPNIAR